MAQADGVADLVHDHVLHIRLRDGVGFRAVHIQAARFEQIHGEMHFIRPFLHVVAGEVTFMRL